MGIGAHFGFIFDGGTGNGSTTSLLFAPYFNYYITKLTNTLWFYGQGVFVISSGTTMEYMPNLGDYEKVSSTYTSININAGLEWRVTKRTNIYGGVGFINFHLDPSQFKIGVMKPFIGINWIIF
jgi:long-subunit fatty acid transport protein